MLHHALVQLEARRLQTLAAARVAGVQDRQVVFLRHLVDSGEQAREVLLGVDVLLAVRGEQDVLALLQTEPTVDIARLDLRQIRAQHLRHRGACHKGALLRQSAIRQIAARVLGIGEIDVGDNVDDTAVGFLRQALVLAAIARLHVEDGDMQPLRADDAQAAVRITQHQHGVGLQLNHQLVRLSDDIAHRLAQITADGVQIDLGISKAEVLEEHAVEVVVVVLPRVGEDGIEIDTALLDDGGKADDLRARADDDEELELAVVFPNRI